jgi:hypothetical protein
MIVIERNELYQLYVAEKLSQKQIAKKFGTWQSIISKKLRKLKIPTRPQGPRDGMKMPEGHGLMEKNSNWRGGIKHRKGRILIKQIDGSYKRRSRLVIGLDKCDGLHVHHTDGDKFNDSPENLQILSNSEHRKLHCLTQPRDESGKFRKVG